MTIRRAGACKNRSSSLCTAAASAKYSSALLGGSLAGPHEIRIKGSKQVKDRAFNICISS